MALPEAAIVLVVWLLHRRRLQQFGVRALHSLATEMLGRCMYCGRGVRLGIGYCDVVCRHGYERRFSKPRWTEPE